MLRGLQSIIRARAFVRERSTGSLNHIVREGYTGDVPRELDTSRFLNRSPESFNPSEWRAVHGLWAAFEIYSAQTTPLHRIRALGASAADCMQTLAEQGLGPTEFEYVPLLSPLPL